MILDDLNAQAQEIPVMQAMMGFAQQLGKTPVGRGGAGCLYLGSSRGLEAQEVL